MDRRGLLSVEEYESGVLREAAKSLNFIWLCARAYRAPELLEFLEALRSRLKEQSSRGALKIGRRQAASGR